MGGMWGIFGKPSKRAIWNTLGLHAVPPICLRFSSGTKTIWPKMALFPVRKQGHSRPNSFIPGSAFLHIGEIDPGPRLIFKPFSCRFQKVCTPHVKKNPQFAPSWNQLSVPERSTILAILDLMSSSAGNEKATTAHAHNNTLRCDTCDRFRASNKIESKCNTSRFHNAQSKEITQGLRASRGSTKACKNHAGLSSTHSV